MNVVLVEPEIAPNVGNVARLCAATRSRLHLVQPFGFELGNAQLKRAGMDYWNHVEWRSWGSWMEFNTTLNSISKFWFIESGGPRVYSEVRFEPEDYLIFGRESTGLPSALLDSRRSRWLRIPMMHPQARSLNLSNCVALVVYEALRQTGFSGQL